MGCFFSASPFLVYAQQPVGTLYNTSEHPARTVVFPSTSIGVVKMQPYSSRVKGGEINTAARGKVTIPAGYISCFMADKNFFAHPQILNSLPPDAFDSIKMQAVALDDSEEGEVDRALAYVGHLTGLREVLLDRSDAGDAGVKYIAALPNVQRIALFSAAVTGDCLKDLSTMKNLKSLRLSQNDIKTQNMKYLGAMPHLESLALGRCRLSDAGIKYLATCADLQTLDISGNGEITDASVKILACLKKLKSLNISQTRITLGALTQLKGLPLISVVRSDQPYRPDELAAIRRIFPGIYIGAKNDRKAIDSETSTIYGPMH